MSSEAPERSKVAIAIALVLASLPVAAFVWGWLDKYFTNGAIAGGTTVIVMFCIAINLD